MSIAKQILVESGAKTKFIRIGNAYQSYEFSKDMEPEYYRDKIISLIADSGDELPVPTFFGVKEYVYLSYVHVPESEKRKGISRKLITKAVKRFGGGILLLPF